MKVIYEVINLLEERKKEMAGALDAFREKHITAEELVEIFMEFLEILGKRIQRKEECNVGNVGII